MTTLVRWPLVAATVVLLSGACSSNDEPHTLTFEVEGEGTVTMTYVINGRSTIEPQVTLPWKKDIKLTKQGEDTWSLVMKREGEGSLSAVAYVDGQPLTRTAGSGTGGGTSRSAAPSAEPTAHSCRPARLHPTCTLPTLPFPGRLHHTSSHPTRPVQWCAKYESSFNRCRRRLRRSL